MKNLPTLFLLFDYFTLELESAHFSGKGQLVNTFSFVGHIVFLILNSAVFTKQVANWIWSMGHGLPAPYPGVWGGAGFRAGSTSAEGFSVTHLPLHAHRVCCWQGDRPGKYLLVFFAV